MPQRPRSGADPRLAPGGGRPGGPGRARRAPPRPRAVFFYSMTYCQFDLKIPCIIFLVKNKNYHEKNPKKILPPKTCPICNSPTIKEKDEAVLRCSNNIDCYAQKLGQIIHFISKKNFNIDGFGEKQAKQFYDLKIITNVSDIFKLEKFKQKITKFKFKLIDDRYCAKKKQDASYGNHTWQT